MIFLCSFALLRYYCRKVDFPKSMLLNSKAKILYFAVLVRRRIFDFIVLC